MQRMTDALSRMLNDPSTRNAMRSARTESQAAEDHPDEAESNEAEPEEAAVSSQTDQSQSNQTSASGYAVSADPANAEAMPTNTSSDSSAYEEPAQVMIFLKATSSTLIEHKNLFSLFYNGEYFIFLSHFQSKSRLNLLKKSLYTCTNMKVDS